MDFDPGSLFASLFVSSIGFVVFMYGKKLQRPPQLGLGLVLMLFPYFVSGALWILLVGAVLLGLLWLLVNRGW